MTTKTAPAKLSKRIVDIADKALAAQAQIALLNEELARYKEDLTTLAVGTEILTDNGKVLIVQPVGLDADAETLKAVASKKVFEQVTETKFAVSKYRAALKLGLVPDEVQALVVEKPGTVQVRFTIAER